MTKIEIEYLGELRTRSKLGENEILTDAPKDNMGRGELFSPTDLLATSLGSCVLTLMGIAAGKLKVDLGKLRLTVDKEMASSPSRKIGRLTIDVYCSKSFPEDVTKKLEESALRCPVHESLHPGVIQEFAFHWGKV